MRGAGTITSNPCKLQNFTRKNLLKSHKQGYRLWTHRFGAKPESLQFPAFQASCVSIAKRRCIVYASNDSQPAISEDVLARLKAAEEEAARLRKQLAATQGSGELPSDVIEAKPKRVDSVDKRETLEFGSKRGSWLSESDVSFFLGNARPGETASSVDEDPEQAKTVQRRLLVGIGFTAAAIAFAFIPTDKLRPKPPKPLHLYLIPLLRSKALLAEAKQIISDADWPTLRVLASRIMGTPNNARDNIANVVAWIDDTATASLVSKLGSEFCEYVEAMDYNKYFDVMPTVVLTGAQNAKFVEFSGGAWKSATSKLNEILAVVPDDALALAEQQLAAGN